MRLRDLGFKLRRAAARRGILGTLSAAPRMLAQRFSRRSSPAKPFNPVHPFDAEFGTDTSGFIAASDLWDSQKKKSVHNTGYYATTPSQFHQALSRLEIDFERFTFVDLGSGKGRVLLMASNFPFRRVLGVELIPALRLIAQQNVARYQPPDRRCQDVDCILGDVRDFVFPLEPLVIFLWNPFVGPVFEQLVQNLDDSLRLAPREVYLVYLKPNLGYLLERIPALHKLWESSIAMTEEEFDAYLYPDKAELCAVYGTR